MAEFAWRRFGQLPAVAVVGAYFAVAVVAAFVLEYAVAVAVVVGVGVVVALYCVARPCDGREVFGAATFPPAIGTLFHELVGTSRWWVLVALMPFSLLLVWNVDSAKSSSGPTDGPDEDQPRVATAGSD